jgi:hypothetical protein
MAELLSLNEQYIIVPAFVGSYGTFECQVQVFTYRSICETQRGLMESPPQLVFGPFRLDPIQVCLWRDEQAIPLRPRAHAVWRYLAMHPGRLVTRGHPLRGFIQAPHFHLDIVSQWTYCKDIYPK